MEDSCDCSEKPVQDSPTSVTSTVPSLSVAKEDPDLKTHGQTDERFRILRLG